jgi:hypothetical protein
MKNKIQLEKLQIEIENLIKECNGQSMVFIIPDDETYSIGMNMTNNGVLIFATHLYNQNKNYFDIFKEIFNSEDYIKELI